MVFFDFIPTLNSGLVTADYPIIFSSWLIFVMLFF